MTKTTITNRSTFSVLPYINKQKVKADGTPTYFAVSPLMATAPPYPQVSHALHWIGTPRNARYET